MIRVSVLYAHEAGKKFDHDYYVNKHMKLVRERLTGFGLVRTEVDKGRAGGAPGAPAPFVAIGHEYFGALTSSRRAWASTARRSWRTWPTTRPSAPDSDQRDHRLVATSTTYDVVVVGGGNAAMCAALSARETGARVLVLEKAPEAWRGGNGFFTAGGFRFGFKSFDELRTLIGDLSDQEAAQMEVDPYTEDNFYDDLMRVTEDCADPDMALFLVRESQNTVRWMKDRGIRWIPMFGRQAYKVGGKFRFWGGLVLEAVGGGPGPDRHGVRLGGQGWHRRPLRGEGDALLTDDRGRVTGLMVRTPRAPRRSTPGPWCWRPAASRRIPRCARVTSAPTGSWLACGARPTTPATASAWRSTSVPCPGGTGVGCHSVQWDLNAPWHGDRKVGDNFQKHSYPVGMIVNLRGERFVDEGADFRNYTYVKYGRAVIGQPRRTAFQIFDQKVVDLLREEYRIREVTRPRPTRWRGWRASSRSTSPASSKTVQSSTRR